MTRLRGANIVMILSALVVLALAIAGASLYQDRGVAYSDFKSYVADGRIEEVLFKGTTVVATLKPEVAGQPPKQIDTVAVPNDDSLIKLLEEKGVKYAASAPSGCGGPTLLSMLLFSMVAFMFLARPSSGAPPGVATFGKSSAKLAPEEGTGVTFADVAGIDEAEEELQEIVQFLKTPERFTRLGGKIPKGVLLIGPPGTGKTLLARAVAGEAGVPFFSISGSDFVEMFVGVGAARVRDLFKTATERAPCIIFIDELDAIGKSRGVAGPVGGHDEREQTLNQLLVEMDGFDGRKGVIILAATNRPETLDAALMRAGRFDRQVVVDRPDVRGREAILKVHARNIKLAKEVDLKVVAQRTPGFAGAELANALNEAALLAGRRGKDEVSMVELDEAVERMALGTERKSRRLSDEERRMTAFHEAGHAVCSVGMPLGYSVSKVSIIPRGMTGGITRFVAPEDRISMSRREIQAFLVSLYGGFAAENEFIGDVTTGAQNDIARASQMARRMVTEFGMSERLGAVNYGSDRPNPFGMGPATRDVAISDDTAREIDAEVRRILDEARLRAAELVRRNRDVMQEMAGALIEIETLDGDRLERLLARVVPMQAVSEIAQVGRA
jgi:cell division protease FtsH